MNADQTLVNMPTIGFGTYLIPNEEAQKTINTALKIGYRHIAVSYTHLTLPTSDLV